MEISDTFQITLKLGGQNFSVKINRDEELFYRDAEKLINQRYGYYANHFPGLAVTTYLLMTVLDIAVRLQQETANGNIQPVMATLNGLINELNTALKQ
ncbi:MAG: cell division protein ZapA [Bacteroidales bacterium]|nr:cell division protein ZapA [Bacteroidales bacterium]